ncbi:MAG: aspartyl/asparaginyl beta-hydroxylase domain-containing protein [Pseudomonadota bacterium]|nr:aspartyl/asparaginyl beta-hydroxylase domain-containing protein [Pseudomonadota bacterium]
MVPSDVPAVRLLEAAAEALRQEALSLPDAGFVAMPSTERYTGAWKGFLLGAGRWEHEFPTVDFPANRAQCPVATAVLAAIPDVTVAGYLRLEPGADLGLHTDDREDDVIRVHLALQLPPDEAAYWPVGTARLLDVRVPHAATNPSTEPRVTFVVDVRLPAPVPVGAVPAWGPPVVEEAPAAPESAT